MIEPRFSPLTIGFMVGLSVAGLGLSSCGSSGDGGSGAGGNSTAGAAGAMGAAGTTGSAGSTGSAGLSGNTGSAGNIGSAGTIGTAGATGTGTAGSVGSTGTAGSGAGTAGGRAGTTGTGGSTGGAGVSGTAGRGGNVGTAGSTGSAGRGGTTGAAGRGGTSGTAGAAGGSGDCPMKPATQTCTGAQPLNPNPFGCSFAWGRQNPSGTGSLSSYNYMQMVANWVESGIRADGTYSSCGGCNWLSTRVSGSNLIPVYYAYMIGYYGHMNGLPDQNTNPNGPNLATGGAALIRANRQKIIDLYAKYAKDSYAVWKTKPLVWFLEGDFIQYTETTQGASAYKMDELGQLAADITCAIKSNMPNAVVAINHTTWNSNEETNCFWQQMNRADYDMVWTTGVGNNGNFIESVGAAGTYNAATATYPYVHALTGKTIAVDTSYGASSMSDSWSNQTAAVLNNHIMNGVIGVNIANNPPSNYQSLITALAPQLSMTCK